MAKQGELQIGDVVLVAGTKSVANQRKRATGRIESAWSKTARDTFDVRCCISGHGEVLLSGCDATGLEKVDAA